jgi:ribosomal protein S18 acetylase RimI-like enzyme
MNKGKNSAYSIRLAKPSDVVDMRKAQRLSWIYAYDHVVPREKIRKLFKIKPESIESMKEGVKNTQSRYWVAVKNDKVVGFCHVIRGKPSEIQAIYLMKSVWGLGLGQKLIDKAFQWLGNMEVIVWTEVGNERAIRFYEKNGFKKTKKTGVYFAKMLKTKFNTIMMKKTVKK